LIRIELLVNSYPGASAITESPASRKDPTPYRQDGGSTSGHFPYWSRTIRYWDLDIVSSLIEPEPPSWDMPSYVIVEPLPVAEWPMLSCGMLMWGMPSCRMLDELFAKAGAAKDAATRAVAAQCWDTFEHG
jgi:hypothetical protein